MEKLKSKKSGKALYIQIKEIYREKILNGELKHGDKIESEMEIQKKYGWVLKESLPDRQFSIFKKKDCTTAAADAERL